ncbi:MAG: translation elongation factor Ts [Rickettsiales bacterium]|nr:translation elongation factor Ts [Rickettsiales bacterium]
MTISANAIKDLREQTGAGMMDCKKALEETKGDFEGAKDWLRAKGLAKAAKKASRVAAEGLVAVATSGDKAVVVELNSETDFVAKNAEFQNLAKEIANNALNTNGDVENIKNFKLSNGTTIQETITNAVAKIGENLNLRRSKLVNAEGGKVFTYVHSAAGEGIGKIGVLVALKGGDENLGKQIAMHIAASKPESLNIETLDKNFVERERKVAAEKARESGKPENIIEKMVEGSVRKYYEQAVLLEQAFIMNPDKKVKDVIAEAKAQITGFAQFTLGEGIEKEEVDFAAEVAATAAGGR